MSQRKTAKRPKPMATPASDPFGFWTTKTFAELTGEQGGMPVDNVENLAAPPGSLWKDDREFDEFLAWLRASRKERG